MTFYHEMVFSFRSAWELDPKRVRRIIISTGICAAFFIIAVVLIFVL